MPLWRNALHRVFACVIVGRHIGSGAARGWEPLNIQRQSSEVAIKKKFTLLENFIAIHL